MYMHMCSDTHPFACVSIPFHDDTLPWTMLLADDEQQREAWTHRLPQNPTTNLADRSGVPSNFMFYEAWPAAKRPFVADLKQKQLTARNFMTAQHERAALSKLIEDLQPTIFGRVLFQS